MFFLGNIGQENVFYDILKRKKRLLRALKTRIENIKKLRFFQRVTRGLCPKMAIIPHFLLRDIDQKNVFYDILERKKAFLGYKNKKFKNLKKLMFFRGG